MHLVLSSSLQGIRPSAAVQDSGDGDLALALPLAYDQAALVPMQDSIHRCGRFTFALPLLTTVSSFSLLFGMTLLRYFSLKHAMHGAQSIEIGTADLSFVVPSNGLMHFAFMSATLATEKLMLALNAPAHFVELLISYLVARRPFWWPGFLGPAGWHCLTYPLFAIPAWWYVGSGADGMLRSRQVSTRSAAVSALLALLFGGLAAVLRFGIGQDPGLIPGLFEGFTLWTLLFAIPFVAWLRQRFLIQAA